MKFVVMAALLLSISAYGMEPLDSVQLRQSQGERGSISFGRTGGVITPLPNVPIEQLCPPEPDPDFVQPDTLRHPLLREKEAVSEVFDGRARALVGYYQAALRSTPCIQGAIVLSFTVSADGRPSNVSYRAENPGIELIAKDVVSEVTRMNFGQASGEETFDWPLNFFNRSW